MSDRERRVKAIVLTAVDECGHCGGSYAIDDIALIGNRGDLWVFALQCPRCRKEGVVAALLNHEPAATAPDAADEDLPRAGSDEPVSAHDVGEMRRFLAGFTGNLADYLRGR